MFISAKNTKLLIGTGNNNSRQLNNIEIIDLETSSTSCQDLPNFPRSVQNAIGGLIFDKHPIICGGFDNTISRSCSSYKNGVWNLFPSMTKPRRFAAASPSPFSNGSLFVTGGGYNEPYLSTAEVLYDDGWQQLSASLPVTIFSHCMVLLNSTTVLIIGGTQGGSLYSSNTYFFNTVNEK